jgi:hypothetical protein
MTVFLFVTASVAVVMGLVGLVAGRVLRTMGHKQAPRASVPAQEQGATTGLHSSRQAGRSIKRRRASTMT